MRCRRVSRPGPCHKLCVMPGSSPTMTTSSSSFRDGALAPDPESILRSFSPPHPEEPRAARRLEGWGGHMVRDALPRSAPHHEAERGCGSSQMARHTLFPSPLAREGGSRGLPRRGVAKAGGNPSARRVRGDCRVTHPTAGPHRSRKSNMES